MTPEERLRAIADIVFAHGDQNDITTHPWWAVVRKNRIGSNAIKAGPFFSRTRAEEYFEARHWEHKGCFVFCFSGHASQHYRDLRELLKPFAKEGQR